jgi:hypothetical protein
MWEIEFNSCPKTHQVIGDPLCLLIETEISIIFPGFYLLKEHFSYTYQFILRRTVVEVLWTPVHLILK